MILEEQLQIWTALKKRVAACHECIDRWPSRVEPPLLANEIPDPRRDISILFVGVAPPPIGCEDDDDVGHFYSNPSDRLRLGLFNVLDHLFESNITRQNRVSCDAGTAAFLDAGFFFVHSAKVRPCGGRLAPDREIMRFCAKQHLVQEIPILSPKAICFLGATNAAPAANAVFRRRIGELPEQVEIPGGNGINGWRGWVAVTVQPVRGTKQGSNRDRTAKVIDHLWHLIADMRQRS